MMLITLGFMGYILYTVIGGKRMEFDGKMTGNHYKWDCNWFSSMHQANFFAVVAL